MQPHRKIEIWTFGVKSYYVQATLHRLEGTITSEEFLAHLQAHAETFAKAVATDEGGWIVKGFIDVYRRIYPIYTIRSLYQKSSNFCYFRCLSSLPRSTSLKSSCLLSKTLSGFDFSRPSTGSLFAVDIKSTYRKNATDVNGNIGAFTGYFRKRDTNKNTLYPYNKYSGHFVLGVIYSQCLDAIDERKSFTLDDLSKIPSVIKDFYFFAQPKYRIAASTLAVATRRIWGKVQKSKK